MFYVYILFSLKDRKLYTGKTNDIHRRFQEHSSGEVKSTMKRRPLKLIYFEAYLTNVEATKREKYLKGGNGRSVLKIQLKDTLKAFKYKYLD